MFRVWVVDGLLLWFGRLLLLIALGCYAWLVLEFTLTVLFWFDWFAFKFVLFVSFYLGVTVIVLICV